MERNKIYLGDNLELLKQMEDNSVDSIVSDIPYNLSFMGKKWDTIKNYQEWVYERAVECLRVLKPGGYCLIFGGSRTHHRAVCAFEDAGFNIKDEMMWLYGSGFPKSYNVSKGFDKKAGAKREVIGYTQGKGGENLNQISRKDGNDKSDSKGCGAYGQGAKQINIEIPITVPSTDLAKQWEGWGTALKPAHEPIMVAQKPVEKNYCYNIEKWGVGGINIDDSKIGLSQNDSNKKGRFPANIILDTEAGKKLDEQTGVLKSGNVKPEGFKGDYSANVYGTYANNQINPDTVYADSGGASRFFYCAKANKKDKTENGQVENKHVTVKPTDLIKYIVRLVTPPNGTCLDICEGSGTHAKACLLLTKEDYPVNYIGFEIEEESYQTALRRAEITKSTM